MIIQHLSNISESRINPYLTAFYKKNPSQIKQAIATYTAIQQRISIYFSLLQEIEVAVRNEICLIWKKQASNNDLKAYLNKLAIDKDSPLSSKSKEQLNKAISKAKKDKPNTYTENDIISNITFGFWVYLFNPKHPSFKHFTTQFQMIFNKNFNSHKQIYNELVRIMHFRNRLYHQEIVWNKKKSKTPTQALQNLEQIYKDFSIILEKIAPERYKMRTAIKLLQLQQELFFACKLFEAEIDVLSTYLD